MKRGISILLVALLTCIQVAAKPASDDWKKEKTIEKQFQSFKSSIRVYKQYLYLEPFQIDDYYASVKDSIHNLKTAISNQSTEISNLKKEIQQLKIGASSVQKKLDKSLQREDNLSVLGGTMNKNVFANIMFIILIILVLVALVLLFLFLRSNKVTVRAVRNYEELSAEFEQSKKRSLEREMKLNRELQTERNKRI